MLKKLSILAAIFCLSACVSQPCNNCVAPSTHTVSEPVEVIYRQTTYQTVYEPKTYSTTRYVKKPYACARNEICK